MDFVPLAVAKEKGIFDRHHINVAIQKFYSANERDAAFQSGIIDGTVIDYTGAVLQKAGGVDLKITSACNATFCIMVGPDSNISQLSDLKGKKVAVSRNTVIDFCIEAALNSAQTSPESIEKQEINKIPIRFEMMMKGESDATALPDPFITMAQSKGARSIVCMQDLDYVLTGFMFKTEAVNQKSEALKAFYLAYNEAVEYIHTHPLDDIRSILVNEIGFPEALVDSVKLPDYTPARMPREKDLNATVEWLKQKDLIPSDFSAEGLADNRFIQP
jgi:NitT/TauT family transport system substrate-binding protein